MSSTTRNIIVSDSEEFTLKRKLYWNAKSKEQRDEREKKARRRLNRELTKPDPKFILKNGGVVAPEANKATPSQSSTTDAKAATLIAATPAEPFAPAPKPGHGTAEPHTGSAVEPGTPGACKPAVDSPKPANSTAPNPGTSGAFKPAVTSPNHANFTASKPGPPASKPAIQPVTL